MPNPFLEYDPTVPSREYVLVVKFVAEDDEDAEQFGRAIRDALNVMETDISGRYLKAIGPEVCPDE